MVRAKVYLKIDVKRKTQGIYPYIQGETEELSDEEIRDWDSTKQKLIENFARDNRNIKDMMVNRSRLDAQGYYKTNALIRQMASSGMLEIDRPVIKRIEPKREKITAEQRRAVFKAISDSVKSTGKEHVVKETKTRRYIIRKWGRGTRAMIVNLRTNKYVKRGNIKANVMRLV